MFKNVEGSKGYIVSENWNKFPSVFTFKYYKGLYQNTFRLNIKTKQSFNKHCFNKFLYNFQTLH